MAVYSKRCGVLPHQSTLTDDCPGDYDADGLPDVWECRYFGDKTIADPNADSDGDCTNNLAEYNALTNNPHNFPEITSQPGPALQAVLVGANVTYSVDTSLSCLGYQWCRATSASGSFAAIPGATNSSLQLNNVGMFTDYGYYKVQVTNEWTTNESITVQLIVNDDFWQAVWDSYQTYDAGQVNFNHAWAHRERPEGWGVEPLLAWNDNTVLSRFANRSAIAGDMYHPGCDPERVPYIALSRRHAYLRGHGTADSCGFQPQWRERKVWFCPADNGEVVEATITNGYCFYLACSGFDYSIVLFTEDLPPSIVPVTVMVPPPGAGLPGHVFYSDPAIADPAIGTNITVWSTALYGYPGASGTPYLIPAPAPDNTLVFYDAQSSSHPSAEWQSTMDILSRDLGLDPGDPKYRLSWYRLAIEDPTELLGLRHWWDFRDTNVVHTTGNYFLKEITQVDDKGPGNVCLMNSTSSLRPSYARNYRDEWLGYWSQDENEYLYTASDISNPDASKKLTVAMVFCEYGTDDAIMSLVDGYDYVDIGVDDWFIYGSSYANGQCVSGAWTNDMVIPTSWRLGIFEIDRTQDPACWKLWWNGVQKDNYNGTSNQGTQANSPFDGVLNLGKWHNTGSYCMYGCVGEVQVFDRILSATEKAALQAYFEDRYPVEQGQQTTGDPAPASYLVAQGFEGTGYDNAETWTEGGTGAVNEDCTSGAIEEQQSLYLVTANQKAWCRRDFPGTEVAEFYFQFKWDGVQGSTETPIFSVRNSSNKALGWAHINTNGVVKLRVADRYVHHTVGTMTANTVYHCWARYDGTTAGNMQMMFGFSTTGTKPKYTVADQGPGDYATSRLTLGNTDDNVTYQYWFDHVRVDDQAIGDNPF